MKIKTMASKDSPFLADFHSHSLLSDGCLLPSELVRRYEVAGFDAVAITDHADLSNIDMVISGLSKVCKELSRYWDITAIAGVELTHLPIEQFPRLLRYARKNGARIIIAHGESPVEPVLKGTNRAAIEAGVDILAHPGNISRKDAEEARKRGVLLEITCRRGHSKTNAHVAKMARLANAALILSSDSHAPEDIPSRQKFNALAYSAGLKNSQIISCDINAKNLFKRIMRLT